MVGLGIDDLEKYCKQLVDVRSAKDKLIEKETKIRDVIKEYMIANNKKQMKLPNYSIELKPRTFQNIDRDRLSDLIRQGVVPADIIRTGEKTFSLLVTAKAEIQLIGNRFIIKNRREEKTT